MIYIVGITALLVIAAAYVFLAKTRKQKAIENFTVWLIFSVFLALTPIIFNGATDFINGSNLDLSQLLGKGELLIVSVAIGADATGKLIASGEKQKIFKIIAAGACILLVIISSLLFAVISRSTGIPIDINRVSSSSCLMFLMIIVAGASCTLLAEIDK
jgi:hypothetical protein